MIEAEETEAMWRIAERLEIENPLWIVVFGVYTREFVAFPRFRAPGVKMIRALYPGAMPGKMRAVEHAVAPKGMEVVA